MLIDYSFHNFIKSKDKTFTFIKIETGDLLKAQSQTGDHPPCSVKSSDLN